METQSSNKTLSGFIWKLLERFGVLGVQFILQIILARILTPEHYGILSIMLIFTTLANVFIQQGFNTSLIQNKDVDEDDYSSVFWISIFIATVLYIIIFICSPYIGEFYNIPIIVEPLRVLALMLFPGALNSIQLAKVTREMDFKKIFYSNMVAVVISGVAGIIVALNGGGLWSLVIQTMLNAVIICVVMYFTSNLKLKFVCNLKRVKVLFSFGWKLLVSSLLDTLYQDLRSMVIGKKYDSTTLGFHERGKQFPQFLIGAINGAIQSVLLPVMSEKQDDKLKIKSMMRTSIMVSAYIIFPMMAGLAAVATPFVKVVLTDKWLFCVPYLQAYCFSNAFVPVQSCNLQAINAMGRSDIFLKLEVIKKIQGVIVLAIVILCFDSPLAIALSGLVTTWTGWFINSYPNKKLVSYSYKEQILDLLPSMIITSIMGILVYIIGFIGGNPLVTMVIQIVSGVIIYILLSVIIKPKAYIYLLRQVKITLLKSKD